MRCYFCAGEPEEGGLIVSGLQVGWVPMEQFKRKGLKRLVYSGVKSIGKINYVMQQVRVPNAYYCPSCKKVMGAFDVTESEEGIT